MSKKTGVEKLVGQDLKGFKIVEMTKVYRVDDAGLKSHTIGYFKDPDVATAFAGMQTDANWHRTEPTLILTDGLVGYIVSRQEPVKLFDDESEAVEIKKRALAKLSPAERKLLGYE